MLEATLDLVKRLEISKELIRECVTVPGCCCMPLLHESFDGLVQLCSQQYITSRQRGVHLHPPYPPKSATEYYMSTRNCSQSMHASVGITLLWQLSWYHSPQLSQAIILSPTFRQTAGTVNLDLFVSCNTSFASWKMTEDQP